MTNFQRLMICTLLLVTPLAAQAERADRSKPVSIEANRGSIDNRKKVHIFEGSVVLTQGTLVIRCDKLVVTQSTDGFQRGVATGGEGGRSSFRQRREGREEYIEGRAERIEYDGREERAVLIGRAEVKSGGDEVHGEYIEFDGKSETYLVTNAKTPSGTSEGGGRVHAIIQPRESANPEAPKR